MTTESIIQAIDTQIVRLQEVRTILSGISTLVVKRRRGRPPALLTATPKKRKLSPEGRAKIAAAQKKRWAAVKAAK